MFWYLLTSKVPTATETKQFQNELSSRAPLSQHTIDILNSLRESLGDLGFQFYR